MEMGTMRTGERAYSTKTNGRIGLAQHMIRGLEAQPRRHANWSRIRFCIIGGKQRRPQSASNTAARFRIHAHPTAPGRLSNLDLHVGYASFYAGSGSASGFGRGRRRGARDGAVHKADVIDRAVAEIGIYRSIN